MKLAVGQKAPEIRLPDQNGAEYTLSQYLGKWVLVYFYPMDDTPGCTKEACALRDNLPHLKNLDAVVLGISSDSVESHKKFEEKYGLPFTLLADEQKQAIEVYDVKGVMGTKRTSFLIDPQGNIAKIYEVVNPEAHAQEVITDLKNLK